MRAVPPPADGGANRLCVGHVRAAEAPALPLHPDPMVGMRRALRLSSTAGLRSGSSARGGSLLTAGQIACPKAVGAPSLEAAVKVENLHGFSARQFGAIWLSAVFQTASASLPATPAAGEGYDALNAGSIRVMWDTPGAPSSRAVDDT